jgi:hypothetical protein
VPPLQLENRQQPAVAGGRACAPEQDFASESRPAYYRSSSAKLFQLVTAPSGRVRLTLSVLRAAISDRSPESLQFSYKPDSRFELSLWALLNPNQLYLCRSPRCAVNLQFRGTSTVLPAWCWSTRPRSHRAGALCPRVWRSLQGAAALVVRQQKTGRTTLAPNYVSQPWPRRS